VVDMAVHLGMELGLSGEALDHLRRGALLHDVGKMGIPDQILLKEGPLSAEEWEIMRMHPVYAQQWLDSIPYLRPAMNVPYSHHEKWDGSGYPGFIGNIFHDPICIGPGKNREEIPLSARIVSLADIYDALISPRSYKNCWSEQKVIDYILDNKGKFFDPEIVDAFFDIYDVIKAIRQKYSDSD